MNPKNRAYPTCHLSIRVPWHDNEWNGTVCKEPKSNNACLILDRIYEERNDDLEDSNAGKSIELIKESDWPICVQERGMFMAPFEHIRTVKHPYSKYKKYRETHGHYLPTSYHTPPYSAPAIPFRWMNKENIKEYSEAFGLEIDWGCEPEITKNTKWIQSYKNQKEILDCFFDHIEPETSLCFFYAKKVPFVEDYGRILIGVGRVKDVGPSREYEYKEGSEGKLRGMIWDRAISHSIRPDFEDGFLLPYHQALEFAEKHPEKGLDPKDLAVFAPEGRVDQFSYVSEHVSNDSAIEVLVDCKESITKAKEYGLKGPWEKILNWIDDRLNEVWKMRGPCPGLGSALNALGIGLGTFIAKELSDHINENENPWDILEEVFDNPNEFLSSYLASQIDTFQIVWEVLPEERKELLKLLSRFDINPDQAKMIFSEKEKKKNGFEFDDDEILENPYLIFEYTKHTKDPIRFITVDHGVFPDPIIRNEHPLPGTSKIKSGIDWRRVRALIVDILERATYEGHTLLPQFIVFDLIDSKKIDPPCELNEDILRAFERYFEGSIRCVEMADGSRAYQLEYLGEMGDVIKEKILDGIKEERNETDIDWLEAVENYFISIEEPLEKSKDIKSETLARKEKSKSLKEIFESRVSVLIGSAGTGKTTLLSILCHQDEIKDNGILLLAPTGKARVKLEQSMKDLDIRGYTIAQFLNSNERFDGDTQRFKLNSKKAEYNGDTIIIDEASMLTEEMLAAVLQSIHGYKRLILVGDPNQLPPIGSGRPFMDIKSKLQPKKFNESTKIGSSYAELEINRRQIESDEERKDIEFAKWFRGEELEPGADSVFDILNNLESSEHLKFIKWSEENEFQEKIMDVLIDELNLDKDDDYTNFNLSIGANNNGYFVIGAAEKVDDWQILTPVRNWKHGVIEINRLLHNKFKGRKCKELKDTFEEPDPMGVEGIIKGEKVINLINRNDKYISRIKKRGYIANGEIGVGVGFYRNINNNGIFDSLYIEFSSQQGYTYPFYRRDFGGDEVLPSVELAYALTVHKAQGSEFGKVILVLPNNCPFISRELIYTALTRQKRWNNHIMSRKSI